MTFALYAVGFALVMAGLIYAAHLMRIPPHWIMAGTLVIVGMGVMSAIKARSRGTIR